jgi:hypothetical protein
MSIHASNNRNKQYVSKQLCVMYLFLIIGCFKPRYMLPNLNEMNVNEQRTETLEEIWRHLDLNARTAVAGTMFGPNADIHANPNDPNAKDTGPGVVVMQNNYECILWLQYYPGMTLIGQEHAVYFRKERFAPQRLRQRDRPDNDAPIYAIFASKTNTWIQNPNDPVNPLDQFVDRFGQPGDQLGVVVCRRQKIEWVQVHDLAFGCDIETWLMFLCFVDRDAQHPVLRRQNPDDYREYLGGRPESSHFENMADNGCQNIIAAIPKNSKITQTPSPNFPPMGNNRILEWQNMHFILAAYIAGYDYLLVKHRWGTTVRRERRTDADCPTMSAIEVRPPLFEEAVSSGPRLRNRYELYWFFCHHIAGHPPPMINVVPRLVNKTNGTKDDETNHRDL